LEPSGKRGNTKESYTKKKKEENEMGGEKVAPAETKKDEKE